MEKRKNSINFGSFFRKYYEFHIKIHISHDIEISNTFPLEIIPETPDFKVIFKFLLKKPKLKFFSFISTAKGIQSYVNFDNKHKDKFYFKGENREKPDKNPVFIVISTI